ncbi:MAG: serine/threonine-protein kinase [Sandaracinaceae bacterium]
MGCAESTLRRLRRQFHLVGTEPLSPVPLVLAVQEELRGSRDYVVAGHLGAGGMGVVYRVMDKESGEYFAAKVLSSHRFKITNTVRDRFLRESELARGFDSPHVVRSIESFNHRGTLVSLMELLPGQTVYDAMQDEMLPDTRERLRWVCDITIGLAYLHQKEIVHRDLSPRNAMFREPSRRVAICDFGVARRTNDLTLTTAHERMGSLLYISPQQRENPHLARYTDDVYSLGQIAYNVLSGLSPFGPLVSLSQLGFSVGLAGWVDKARARRPEDRFEDAVQARDALSSLLGV